MPPTDIPDTPQGGHLPALREGDILSLLSQAIQNGTSVDTLERLVALRQRLKDEWAEERFNEAMTQFQVVCPIVRRNKPVRDKNKRIAYRYAPIEDIVKQVGPYLSNHGFSYHFDTETMADTVRATCIITHRNGHSKSSRFELPLIERTALMNSAHQVEGTLTICMRKALCNALGIMTDRDDTNGIEGRDEESGELIGEGDIKEIDRLLQALDVDKSNFLRRNKIDSLDQLTLAQGGAIVKHLSNLLDKRASGV